MRFGLILVAAATIGGCATGSQDGGKASEVDRLARDCEARGGILAPIPGAHNGNEAANHACEFRGMKPRAAPGS